MRLSRISDLQAFVAVVEKASLTSAAHQLGRSLQSVSRSLAAIEQDVGVELIRRTTRRSNPTEAGLAYYQRLKTALEDIEEAKLQVSASKARAIRVAAHQRPNRICSAASGSGDGRVPRSSIQRSKSKSAPTTVMSILSKTTSILPCISGRCPTRWPKPSVLPICGGYSLPRQATSPNTAGRNIRRIFQSINASFARRGSARISGHSRWTARSGRSRYPGVFAPMAPASSTKRQLKALELPSRRFGRSGH